MLIAITDSRPNLPESAEREFMRRFEPAATRAGHNAVEVVTSDDIYACSPDFVLCMHEFTAKLTPFPTFGVIWSPPEFYRHDAYRIRSIRSYDAYLVGSEDIRQYLDDLEFHSNTSKPKSSFHFLPVAPVRPPLIAKSSRERRSLAYIGVHWDGSRHGAVMNQLLKAGAVTVYGPKSSWSHLRSGYGGPISFDGSALFDVLTHHGIALCLHKEEHRKADTPSMRLFEAAAAGCVIISDEIPYAKRMLDDTALYVDLRQPPSQVAQTIQDHVNWVAANPEKADAMAYRSQIVLNHENSLEDLIVKTCRFAEDVAEIEEGKRIAVNGFSISSTANRTGLAPSTALGMDGSSPVVDIVIRCGGRGLDYVKRAIDSVDAQTVGSFRVILVDYKGRSDLKQFTQEAKYDNVIIKYIQAPNNGLRSTPLWIGFAEVAAPFFAVMDDDDTVMPEHYCNLLFSAIKNPDSAFFYCGVIQVEEDGKYISAPNFDGPGKKIIAESRGLRFLDEFNLQRLIAFDNYIQSNAWIARSNLLDEQVLIDPLLQFAEDMYLYILLASKTKFVLSNHPTAYWHWRSNARDNSMFEDQSDAWKRCADRIILRLKEIRFPHTATFMELWSNQRQLNEVSLAIKLANRYPMAHSFNSKKVGPIKKLLRSIPMYNSYREGRNRRRQMRRASRGQLMPPTI